MLERISVSPGAWMTSTPTGLEGCHEIMLEDGKVIGMAHEYHDAVLMCCSKEFFDALVDVHDILQRVEDSTAKELIEERLSQAFAKVVAEADV